jgi:hypothetical protein
MQDSGHIIVVSTPPVGTLRCLPLSYVPVTILSKSTTSNIECVQVDRECSVCEPQQLDDVIRVRSEWERDIKCDWSCDKSERDSIVPRLTHVNRQRAHCHSNNLSFFRRFLLARGGKSFLFFSSLQEVVCGQLLSLLRLLERYVIVGERPLLRRLTTETTPLGFFFNGY